MAPPVRPVEDRIIKGRGCWLWDGAKSVTGYSMCYVGRGPNKENLYRMAHRVVYEHLVGPIPEGQDLHHTCGNKWCVNLRHLVPVTDSEHRTIHHAANALCANGLHPKVPGEMCSACRQAKYRRNNQQRPSRARVTTPCPRCGRSVGVGYLSRHLRGCLR